MNLRNLTVCASLITTALGAGACGSSSPSAPSQLSGSQNSVISNSAAGNSAISNGATINGSITGTALTGLSDSSFASLAGPALTVTVVGTSITAPVNGNGTFVLTNVPSGDIQLRFTGAGTDALLTVTGVTGGDEIRITVQVNGNTASLQNVSRKDKVNKVEVEGRVVSGSCTSFIVNGTTIRTDAATQFSKGTCANVVAGAGVTVKGSTQTGGSVLASEVKFEKDDDGEEKGKTKVELEGLVTAGACGSFTVKGIVVTTNAATVFKNGRCNEMAAGVRVHVTATPTGTGTALATLVNVQRDADNNGKSGDRDDDDDDEDEDEDDEDDEKDDGGNNGRGNGGSRR